MPTAPSEPPASSPPKRFRRLKTPITATIRGQAYRSINWSPSGVLLEIERTTLDPAQLESATLQLPCRDGSHALSVSLRPIRANREGWACAFIDLPPRDLAVLTTYADAMLHGFTITTADLDSASANPSAAEESAPLLEEPIPGAWDQSKARPTLRRAFFVLVLIGVLAFAGSMIIPFFTQRFLSRLKEGEGYLQIAESRLRTAQIIIDDLDAKIRTVTSLLDSNQPQEKRLPISTEQKRMLELGLNQLENERKMATVHIEVLRKNLSSIQQGNYFFEQSILHNYGTESRTDPAPYVTQILTDIAVSSRVEPHKPDDIQKYLRVAKARVQQAEFQLQSAHVQRQALEAILARSSGTQQGALPYNSIELMKRDIALLKLDEARISDLLTVLRDNVQAVSSGNFMYETNLLERFSPETLRTSTPNDNALTR